MLGWRQLSTHKVISPLTCGGLDCPRLPPEGPWLYSSSSFLSSSWPLPRYCFSNIMSTVCSRLQQQEEWEVMNLTYTEPSQDGCFSPGVVLEQELSDLGLVWLEADCVVEA